MFTKTETQLSFHSYLIKKETNINSFINIKIKMCPLSRRTRDKEANKKNENEGMKETRPGAPRRLKMNEIKFGDKKKNMRPPLGECVN